MAKKVSSNSEIIQVDITNDMLDTINETTRNMGVLNSKTLVNGEGNRSGIAGELIVKSYLPMLDHYVANLDYDFKDSVTGFKIDVKTKGNSFRPEIGFDCTVPSYQKIQDCDIYIFTRVSKDEKRGWINGWIRKQEFDSICKVRQAGTNYNNAGRASVGSHKVVLINELYPIELLKNYLLVKHKERQESRKEAVDSSSAAW